MKFSALQLAEPIVRAVTNKGYETATEIQAGAIPPGLEGRDILGTAQTGTGKTCAFALPILHRLSLAQVEHRPRPKKYDRNYMGRPPRALVLAPTRELATQIHDSFVAYGRNLKLRQTVVYGGVNQFHQVRALQNGIDILVATPGRLRDLHEQGFIDLSKIETLVLDEADRMLDMGFISDIQKIVKLLPKKHQTMLFSATLCKTIRGLTDDLLKDPVLVETAPEATTVETINQRFFMIDQAQKASLLIHLVESENMERALVFARTKHKADRIARWLNQAGIRADAIHSNKTQNARNTIMRTFRTGHVKVLVATDIASRGIDVDNITHVFNFDMPVDPETYVHRIGRTARAGASGTAITFCQKSERKMLRSIEERSDIKLPKPETAPNLEERIKEMREARSNHDSRSERDSDTRSSHDSRRERRRFDSSGKKPWKKVGERNGYQSRDQRDGNRSDGYKKNSGQNSYQSRDGEQRGSFKKKPWKKSGENSYQSRDGEQRGSFKKKPWKKSGENSYQSRDGDQRGSFKKKPWKKSGENSYQSRDGDQRGSFRKKPWKKSGENSYQSRDGEQRGSFRKKPWKKSGENSYQSRDG
ncbi:MAG: hypothetical protein CMJ39_13330, partial [Phycisphaerae bacterium]|nr:hypothetical protein [Phycisphaerae bacterium]